MAVNCPECESEIDLDEMDVDIDDELSCAECGALIRVVNDSPIELELADDDDEEDEEEEEEEDDEDGEEDGWSEPEEE